MERLISIFCFFFLLWLFILYDLSSRMTKLSHTNEHFQIDEEKGFVSFHFRTINLCKVFTVLTFKYNIGEYGNAIKMVFSAPFLLRLNVLAIKLFNQ